MERTVYSYYTQNWEETIRSVDDRWRIVELYLEATIRLADAGLTCIGHFERTNTLSEFSNCTAELSDDERFVSAHRLLNHTQICDPQFFAAAILISISTEHDRTATLLRLLKQKYNDPGEVIRTFQYIHSNDTNCPSERVFYDGVASQMDMFLDLVIAKHSDNPLRMITTARLFKYDLIYDLSKSGVTFFGQSVVDCATELYHRDYEANSYPPNLTGAPDMTVNSRPRIFVVSDQSGPGFGTLIDHLRHIYTINTTTQPIANFLEFRADPDIMLIVHSIMLCGECFFQIITCDATNRFTPLFECFKYLKRVESNIFTNNVIVEYFLADEYFDQRIDRSLVTTDMIPIRFPIVDLHSLKTLTRVWRFIDHIRSEQINESRALVAAWRRYGAKNSNYLDENKWVDLCPITQTDSFAGAIGEQLIVSPSPLALDCARCRRAIDGSAIRWLTASNQNVRNIDGVIGGVEQPVLSNHRGGLKEAILEEPVMHLQCFEELIEVADTLVNCCADDRSIDDDMRDKRFDSKDGFDFVDFCRSPDPFHLYYAELSN